MPNEPDPRLVKLVRALDEERQRRMKAEKAATALRGVLTRVMKARRTDDAQPQQEYTPRAEC